MEIQWIGRKGGVMLLVALDWPRVLGGYFQNPGAAQVCTLGGRS